MDPKPEDILTVDLTVDIDPTILLGLAFEKMKFVSQSDVESVLSESDSKISETNNTTKYFGNLDSQTSDTYSESDVEETTPDTKLDTKKDINGNEETLSDYNLNRLFCELELNDSENEEEDEEPSPKLRERGGPDRNRTTRNQNRTNYLKSSDKFNRSQIDPRNLLFLSGSTFVDSSSASHYLPLEDNHLSVFNSNKVFYNNGTSNEPVSTSYPQFCEDFRANSVGSPESGYESSSTGSPPPIFSSTAINHRLELISQLDEDQMFVNCVIEDPAVCALIDQVVPEQLIDNGENIDKERRINELVEFLKDASSELVEVAPTSSDRNDTDIVPLVQSFAFSDFVEVNSSNINTDTVPLVQNFASSELVEVVSPNVNADIVSLVQNFASSELVEVASPNRNIDIVPVVQNYDFSELVEVVPSNGNSDIVPLEQNFEDINNFDIVLPPKLKNAAPLRKLGYKLKDTAKKELRRFLSIEKFWSTETKIFKRLIEDQNKKKPIRVIYIDDEIDKQGENRTNLHHAVLKRNMEEIYCLVEIQKIYDLPFSDLNIRDKYEKTALDYAFKKPQLHVVIDYLKENNASRNVIV